MADNKDTKYQDILDNYKPGCLAPQDGPPLDEFPDKDKMPKDMQKQLEKLISSVTKRDLYPRRFEVRDARLQRFYYRGDQHLIFNANENTWNVADRSSGGVGEDDISNQYRYVLNIYFQCAKTLIASLTQNLPGVRFQPQDPKDPKDITTSHCAEKLKLIIERNNNINDLMQNAAMRFWTDGRTAFYTRYVTNGQGYGYKDDDFKEPIGQEQIDVYGVLEVKVPISARNQSEYTFLQCSTEIDILEAKARFPQYACKIKPGAGLGENEYDRTARLGVIQGTELLSQTGDAFANLVTFQRTWLRPSAFLELEDEDARTYFLEKFPNGGYFGFCGRTYVESRSESLDDHWVVVRPNPGDGQDTASLGKSVVEVQDMINDLIMIRMQTYKYQIPAVWFDPNVIDGEAFVDQKSTPGMHYPVKDDHEIPPGSGIASAFYAEPMASISPDLGEWMQELMGPILQNLTGLQPAIFGGADESNETASGIAQLRSASLAQLGPSWSAIKNAYAKMIEQAVKCASNRTEDIGKSLPSGKDSEEINIDIEDLTGNVECFPDQTEGLPQTLDQKSSAMELLVTSSANLPALNIVLNDPNNIELMGEYSGLDDLVIPGRNERNKQLTEIDELLNSTPVPTDKLELWQNINKISKENGRPMIPKPADNILYDPSIPIDPDFDDNNIEWNTVKEWINSPEGQKEREDNPDGFKNVRLHGLLHKAEVDKEAEKNAQQSQPPKLPTPKLPTKEIKSNSLTGAVETTQKDIPLPPPGPAPEPGEEPNNGAQ